MCQEGLDIYSCFVRLTDPPEFSVTLSAKLGNMNQVSIANIGYVRVVYPNNRIEENARQNPLRTCYTRFLKKLASPQYCSKPTSTEDISIVDTRAESLTVFFLGTLVSWHKSTSNGYPFCTERARKKLDKVVGEIYLALRASEMMSEKKN